MTAESFSSEPQPPASAGVAVATIVAAVAAGSLGLVRELLGQRRDSH